MNNIINIKNQSEYKQSSSKISTVKRFFVLGFRGLEWIVFIVLSCLALLLLAPYLPTSAKFSTYTIASGSMKPTIPTGSIVLTQADNNLKVGDVIAFKSPEDSSITIVHRVIGINNGHYLTKGDNNTVSDNWEVTPSQVNGKILFHIPHIGTLSSKVSTPKGFALFVGIPGILLVIIQLKRIYEGIEEEIQKRTHAAVSKISVESHISNSNKINSLI